MVNNKCLKGEKLAFCSKPTTSRFSSEKYQNSNWWTIKTYHFDKFNNKQGAVKACEKNIMVVRFLWYAF